MQNAVRSGIGLLGMHPTASLTHPMHQSGLSGQRMPGMSGQRMPGLLPMEVRPNLLQQGPAARFPLLMQQGPAQQAAGHFDSSLQAQARPRAPFPHMDIFNRTPNLTSENVSKTEDESSSGADEGKDQDYRFPPIEKQSTGLLRTPPPEHREPLGGAGGPGGGRPPLLQTPGTQPGRSSLVGRLHALAGFTPDNRWNQIKGDFDERGGMRGGPQAPGGPKGFQDERPSPGQNFSSRFDNRPGVTGGAGPVGGPQPWNRGGGATAPFSSELQKDLDDRRRPWERQRDRDERDDDFRRDINGNRQSRERERERDRGRERTREHERERESDKEKERERGGWTPILPLPTPLLPTPPIKPNLTLNQGKLLVPLKFNPQIQPRFQSPLFSQSQAKSPLLGLKHPLPLAQIRSPPPSQNQASAPEPQSKPPDLDETPQAQSARSPRPLSDSPCQSTLTEPPTQPEPSPKPETPAQIQSPPQNTTCPDTKTQSPLSLLAVTQADAPPEDSSSSVKKQEEPQKDEDRSQEKRSSTPQPEWANGPEKGHVNVAEPASDPEHRSSLFESDTEPKQEQVSSPKDLNNEQKEPMEEAQSQPVVDTVTDTEGT